MKNAVDTDRTEPTQRVYMNADIHVTPAPVVSSILENGARTLDMILQDMQSNKDKMMAFINPILANSMALSAEYDAHPDAPKPAQPVSPEKLEKPFPQRNEAALDLLLERLELIQGKLAMAHKSMAEEGMPAELSAEELIIGECSSQLISLYCRLRNWQHHWLSRLDLEHDGYSVDDIGESEAEETAED